MRCNATGRTARARRAWSSSRRQESATSTELEEDRTVEAQGRIENLQELAGVAAEIRRASPTPSLDEFLEQVSLVASRTSTRRTNRSSR